MNIIEHMTLCAKCAALMTDAYIVKKVSGGVDYKVDCCLCHRHRFGGVYDLTRKGGQIHEADRKEP